MGWGRVRFFVYGGKKGMLVVDGKGKGKGKGKENRYRVWINW
jgi:hypothetical protein